MPANMGHETDLDGRGDTETQGPNMETVRAHEHLRGWEDGQRHGRGGRGG